MNNKSSFSWATQIGIGHQYVTVEFSVIDGLIWQIESIKEEGIGRDMSGFMEQDQLDQIELDGQAALYAEEAAEFANDIVLEAA